jgi:nicotinamide-nucleotide amidase
MQYPDKSILNEIHLFFKKEQLVLSVVESCSGGLIASLITDIPGASGFFDSGIVAYSNESKTNLVSVKSTTLIKQGVISEETARQMAEGMRRLRKTDYTLSITGNLGPSALEEKDVGLVYFAVSSQDGTVSKEMRFTGTRKRIKKLAAWHALNFLHQVLPL